MSFIPWLAAVTVIAGALCLYLATPHQVLIRRATNARAYCAAGFVLLIVALGLLLAVQGPATAVFTWMTGAMLVWSVAPVAVRWWQFGKEAQK